MMIKDAIILGASGRIGTALSADMKCRDKVVKAIDRDTYYAWTTVPKAVEGLKAVGLGPKDVLFYAAGIIDPREDIEQITHVNFTIALNACMAARQLGARAVSFGTVMERIIPLTSQNPYMASKSRLQKEAEGHWLHLQLHTLYGGKPPTSFMFTGLMFDALKSRQRFSMTSGDQLREYHHIEDDAAAIFSLASKLDHGCLDVSHGQSIPLCDLAKGVFEYFGQADLLGIGDLVSPDVEAYEPVFERQLLIKDINFRPALPAVPKWLELGLQNSI